MKLSKRIKNYFLIKTILFIKKCQNIPKKNNQKILIISMTGLGDSLWATPAIREIKNSSPKSKIFVLTNNTGFEIFQNNPYIEKIILFKKPHFIFFPQILYRLLQLKCFTVLIFHATQRMILVLSTLIKAKEIISIASQNKGLDCLFTKLIKDKNIHEITKRFLLASLLKHQKIKKTLNFFPTVEELQYANIFFKKIKYNEKKTIILHPGAQESYKCWPKEYFIELANLLQKHEYKFIVTGTSKERHLVDFISNKINGVGLININIRKLAALLSKCSILITNDTGPMHLANSLKTPIIALFSPTNPSICGPEIDEWAKVLYKPKTCKKCIKRRCHNPICLKQIKPKDVYSLAINTLKKYDQAQNSNNFT